MFWYDIYILNYICEINLLMKCDKYQNRCYFFDLLNRLLMKYCMDCT